MSKIIQLSPHIANLIAAGEVVERPASVVKELLENAVDAGATQVTVEIRDGGMTFLRVTDNGCGMEPEDARTAFLRHATSKLRTADDLAAIGTMGFRGEALAAIASVSRIDLLTKTAEALTGISLQLESGNIIEESEAGCPTGTTIIVRDLFFNTPARMKFMKSDSVEGGKVTAAVQAQALAHPEVGFRFLRDGKEILSTSGTGGLGQAVYCIYGKAWNGRVPVESRWDSYTLTGYVSKPTDARPSRNMQTFFVNGRPVRSRLLIAALEEAYRNQIMGGRFPACVLHLTLPASAVDVNVHPAKTEVKFLNEKAVFDCVHYGVLGALNRTPDRPQVQFKPDRQTHFPGSDDQKSSIADPRKADTPKQQNFFQTMSAQEYKQFATTIKDAPRPSPLTAAAVAQAVERDRIVQVNAPALPLPPSPPEPISQPIVINQKTETAVLAEVPEQETIPIPKAQDWRLVGELYRTYVIVEQRDNAFLIDKHAAHERILFEKLKANQEAITSQALLTPIPCQLRADAAAELMQNRDMLEELGFEVDSFGDDTLLIRQIPMDLPPEDAADTLEGMAADLMNGRREDRSLVRDEVLHSVACKAAIKAGWNTSETELRALVDQVMAREDLKYCPHGRPICVTLSKKQLEKQFKRS